MHPGNEEVLFALWAKSDPRHPLPCHLLDVGNVAETLLSAGPFEGTQRRFAEAAGCPQHAVIPWLAYLSSLHDLGKCHPEFQGQGGPELMRPLVEQDLGCTRTLISFRHEAVSAAWVMDRLIEEGWPTPAANALAAAIRGHHGNFAAEAVADSPGKGQRWLELRTELARAMHEVFEPPNWDAPAFADHSAAGLLLSGLIVLSDWIASNSELFTLGWEGTEVAAYAPESRARARTAVRRLGLAGTGLHGIGETFRVVWPAIASPRQLQETVERAEAGGMTPGLTIIEAPMGEGKTEAALYLAMRWIARGAASGIYVALPTAATSNQMFGRVRELLTRHDAMAADGLQLVHGASWLLDRTTPETAPTLADEADLHAGELALDWFRPRKRSLLGAFGVGTVDQAEMSVLNVKHGFLRLYGLAQKVLVIDEVHAYDAYQTEIIRRLLAWCRALGTPVIMLSATLPAHRREELVEAYAPEAGMLQEESAYPLITHVSRDGTVTLHPVPGSARQATVKLTMHPGLLQDPEGTARLVAQRVLAVGGCHAVIANTVGSAQEIYRCVERELAASGCDDIDLRLFHARFPVGARQAIEDDVLRLYDKRSLSQDAGTYRPERAVLVATQVVEQSLDLDFDEMYSQLAPIDLLLQRSGRLHRHDRLPRRTGPDATLHVLLPDTGSMDFGPTARVYHPYILSRTIERLSGPVWHLPADMRGLVEGVYGPPQRDETELSTLSEQWRKGESADADKALKYLIPEPLRAGYKLARLKASAYTEDDGNIRTYFTARTRSGDESLRAVLLEDDEFEDVLRGRKAPERDLLNAILRRAVSLPVWWLAKAEPVEGFRAVVDAPAWMHGVKVLRLREGRWRGRLGAAEFTVTLDPIYGVMRAGEEEIS